MSRSKNKGFTLLEILLGLSVLIVLALSFVGYMQKANQKKTVLIAAQEINMAMNAALQYRAAYSQWPSNLNVLLPFFISNTIKLNPSFCSPWRSKLSCEVYSIASPVSSPYFAIQITTPNVNVAQNLKNALPNAYTSGATTIAYTTASMASIQAPVPTGVLYASPASVIDYNNANVPDNCARSNPRNKGSKTYWTWSDSSGDSACSIFFEQQPPLNSSAGPYGLSVTSSSSGLYNSVTHSETYQPQYFDLTLQRAIGGKSAPTLNQFSQNDLSPNCPLGSSPTLIFLPTAAYFTNAPGGGKLSSWNFGAFYAHISVHPGNGPKSDILMGCINSNIYNSLTFTNIAQVAVSSMSDILCIPDDQMSSWPDHNQTGSTGFVCPPDLGSLLN